MRGGVVIILNRNEAAFVFLLLHVLNTSWSNQNIIILNKRREFRNILINLSHTHPYWIHWRWCCVNQIMHETQIWNVWNSNSIRLHGEMVMIFKSFQFYGNQKDKRDKMLLLEYPSKNALLMEENRPSNLTFNFFLLIKFDFYCLWTLYPHVMERNLHVKKKKNYL